MRQDKPVSNQKTFNIFLRFDLANTLPLTTKLPTNLHINKISAKK